MDENKSLKLAELLENKAFFEKLQGAGDKDAALSLFKEQGLDLSMEELSSLTDISDEQRTKFRQLQEATRKVEELFKDPEVKSSFCDCTSIEDMIAFLKEKGIENAEAYVTSLFLVTYSAQKKYQPRELTEAELDEIVGGFSLPSWLHTAISFIPVVGAIVTTIESVSNMSSGGAIAARILLGLLQCAIDVGTTVSATGLVGVGIRAALGQTISNVGTRIIIGVGVAAIRGGQGLVGDIIEDTFD